MGNFLVYDFWTPRPPSYQFCTWILNVRHVAAALGPQPVLAAALGPESVLI